MQTLNYNQFKFFTNNRPIIEGKVKRFIKSINEVGYIKSMPVTVTPNYEIIDGQHRFKACEKLKIPIFYSIIYSNISPDKLMIELNKNNDVWKLESYIHHYADKGINYYIQLQNFIKKYKINTSIGISICSDTYDIASTSRSIRVGKNIKLYDKREDFYYYLKSMESLPFYLNATFVRTLIHFYKKANNIQKKKLLEKCLLISRQGDSSEYKRVFMNIVNKGKNQENYLIL
jgi:hypothetical protein